jgi:hypothetical protein
MSDVGEHIAQLKELIKTPMVPPPPWARRWQAEAEHILHLAQDADDLECLNMLKLSGSSMIAK